MYKISTKPLHGSDYITTTETTLIDSSSFQEAISTTVISTGLDNVTITNSIIDSTDIGTRIPGLGQFSDLRTFGTVRFYNSSSVPSVEYNPITNKFTISGRLNVVGCSQLGNIEICNNDIKAINTNGDINIIPNGTGELNISSSVFNVSTTGNFYSNMTNGSYAFIAKDEISMSSSNNDINLSAQNDINISTTNGNLSLSVDNGIKNLTISSIFKNGSTNRITTTTNHDLQVGNNVTITNTNSIPSFNGVFTVTQILSNTQFSVNDSVTLTTNSTTGTVRKSATNQIILDSDFLVTIPSNTLLTFGSTQNNISGNTGGLIVSSSNNVVFSLPTTSNVIIPQTSKLQFGTSGNSFTQFSGSSLNINSPTTTLTGTTLQINNTNVRFSDPILTIADYNLSNNDSKDRGVEFRYYNTTQRLGWFGYKNSLDAFTFMTSATNSNEQITGDIANIVVNDIKTTSVTLNTGGNINMNCGLVQNVNTIRGCGTTLNVEGPGIINLTATSNINIPNNIPLNFGTSQVIESSSSNLSISTPRNIIFSTQTNGSITIPVNTKLSFDNTTRGSQSIVSNTSGELIIYGNSNLYLSTTSGNVIIPNATSLQLGNSSQTLTGITSGISLLSASGNINLISNSSANLITSSGNILLSNLSGDIILSPTIGNVRIPISRALIFSMSNTVNSIQSDTSGNLSILGNTSNGNIKLSSVSQIDLLATSNVNIPQGTRLNLTLDSSKSLYSNSTQLFIQNNTSNGDVVVTSANTIISNSNSLSVINSSTNITSTSLIISGTTTTINSNNVQIKDPIVSIAYNLTDTVKDRGIEYSWMTNGNSKLGWFGYKTNTGKLTFYSDAINTNEVITGTLGELQVSNLSLQSNGYLDVNCGELRSARLISGCSGTVEITAENILLSANSRILLPFNKQIHFGSSNNNISANTSGTITVNSTSFFINSDSSISGSFKTNDPILTVGGLVAPINNDLKDRGVEFRYYNVSQKLGYFGYKENTGRFVFIKDGINNNEIFSGTYGDVEFGTGYFNNLNLNNGIISGVSQLSGGEIRITTTSGNIFLTPNTSGSTILPFNSTLSFGNTSNSISSSSNGNLLFDSTNITLSPDQSVRITDNVPLYFGNDNNVSIQRTQNSLNITTSAGNIFLTPQPSIGNVILPVYNSISFNDTSNRIFSDGSKLYLVGSAGIQFEGNVNFTGVLTASQLDFDIDKYILPLGKYQNSSITNIKNSINTGVTQITTSLPNFLSIGDKVIITNTNSIPTINGEYTVSNIISNTTFTIITGSTITTQGGIGNVKSNLMSNRGKDIGIQVNYWKNNEISAPLSLITAGSTYYKTGFFGFKLDTERWTFYNNAIIANDVATGTLGNLDIDTLYTNKISGFQLIGSMSAGNNRVSGDNFNINGGVINSTPIGLTQPAAGNFNTVESFASSNLANLTLKNRFILSKERLVFNSSNPVNSIDTGTVISFISVVGVNFTDSSSTMSNFGVTDGAFKMIICTSMGTGCNYTIHFPSGTLIAPNPLNTDPTQKPTKIIFKRQSQSVQLVYDSVLNAWVLLNSGAYIA